MSISETLRAIREKIPIAIFVENSSLKDMSLTLSLIRSKLADVLDVTP